MNYLKSKDVVPGLITKIYLNKNFEGFAILVEPFGEWDSYIEEGNGPVFAKQRWLVEWIDPGEHKLDLTVGQLFTQRSLAGLKAHRNIEFVVTRTWDQYWYKYGRFNKKKDISDER